MYLEQFMNHVPHTSGFASDHEFSRDLHVVDPEKKLAGKYGGVVLYSHQGKAFLDAGNEKRHVLCFGSTGSGKTRRVLLPSILHMIHAKNKSSFVCFNTKSEIYDMTAHLARKNGFTVKVINLRDITLSDPYNPFGEANRQFFESKDTDAAWAHIEAVIDAIFQDTSNPKAGSSNTDPFWRQSSSAVFKGLVSILWEAKRKEVTPQEVLILLNQLADPDSSACHTLYKVAEAIGENSLANVGLKRLKSVAPVTRGCIIASVYSYLTPLISNKRILDFLSTKEGSVDFQEIGKKLTACYFILPDDSTALASLQSLCIRQLIQTLNQLALANGGRLIRDVDIVIDELANITPRIDELTRSITVARSMGIRYLLSAQNLTQLRSVYGEHDAETILANCYTHVILFCGKDNALIQRISQTCGNRFDGMPLITEQDLSLLPVGQAVVLRDRSRPFVTLLDDVSQIIAPEKLIPDTSVSTFAA